MIVHTSTLVVPGMGTTLSPWASSQARVTCAGVASCRPAISFKPSTSFIIAGKLSLENLVAMALRILYLSTSRG